MNARSKLKVQYKGNEIYKKEVFIEVKKKFKNYLICYSTIFGQIS